MCISLYSVAADGQQLCVCTTTTFSRTNALQAYTASTINFIFPVFLYSLHVTRVYKKVERKEGF